MGLYCSYLLAKQALATFSDNCNKIGTDWMNSAVLHVGLLVCSLHFKLLATEIEQRVISEACLLAFACMQRVSASHGRNKNAPCFIVSQNPFQMRC